MRPEQRIAFGFIVFVELVLYYFFSRGLGIITAYRDIASKGNREPAVVAVGISLGYSEIAIFAVMALPAFYAIISGIVISSRSRK